MCEFPANYDHSFGNFFNHVDNFPSETFLFVTSGGIEATTIKDQEISSTLARKKAEFVDAEIQGDGDDVDSAKEDGAGNEG